MAPSHRGVGACPGALKMALGPVSEAVSDFGPRDGLPGLT